LLALVFYRLIPGGFQIRLLFCAPGKGFRPCTGIFIHGRAINPSEPSKSKHLNLTEFPKVLTSHISWEAWYAIAKIAGPKLSEAIYRQHGANFISAMPCNLYGLHDNFDLESSHMIPALMRKIHEAKTTGQSCCHLMGQRHTIA